MTLMTPPLPDPSSLKTDKPWRGQDFAGRHNVPTMLSVQELGLLQWSTQYYYRGEGEIIDAGCFLGGSTMALADGLCGNPGDFSKRNRVHSLDRFFVGEEELHCTHITPFAQIRGAGSFRAAFDENTRPLRSFIQVEETDICQYRWDGRPVEILFIDVAKTPEIDEHLIREFYPRLIPGRSLLIHQDYLWSEIPWLVLSMDFFSEYFEILDDLPYATRVFRCVKAIPPEVAATYHYRQIPLEVADASFARARATIAPEWIPNLLLNQARFARQRNLPDRIVPLLAEAMQRDPSGAVIEGMSDYFSEVLVGPDWMELSSPTYDPAFGLISQISCSEAQLLFALIYGLAPARLVEVGRARGGSTFVIASALRAMGRGRLVSVDPNCLAEHRISPALKVRLAPWVDFIDGYAPYVLPEAETLAGGKFDFAFIDGDHSFAACERDIAGTLPHLLPGAWILLHDAHFGGVQEAVASSLGHLPLLDRGSLISDRCETLTHILYKDRPSYYGGLRLLQYVPPGHRLYEFGEECTTSAVELQQLRDENARLRRALKQNTREWEG